MNNLYQKSDFKDTLTSGFTSFETEALRLFALQTKNNSLYASFLDHLGKNSSTVVRLQDIPSLPIRFFKSHEIRTGDFTPECWFESSGTTGSVNSRHGIRSLKSYLDNALLNFSGFYGDPSKYCVLALLPSYLERGNSSLVAMAEMLIRACGHPDAGFYLYDHESLVNILIKLNRENQPVILLGVTYALLDMAEKYQLELTRTIVMETGGMKGRREEMTRSALHDVLKSAWGLSEIHAEYGMTELQSQAYSFGDGIFYPSSTMRMLLRSPDDPFEVWLPGEYPGKTGVINVIDLANADTIAFIATDDLGRFTADGGMEILGRVDNCDIRGCSLLAV